MTDGRIFGMKIADGYYLRNTLNIIKNEIDKVTLCINSKSVRISFVNRFKVANHIIDIFDEKLLKFAFTPQNDIEEEYKATIPTADLVNSTKPIGKKDQVSIYIDHARNFLSVQPIKAERDVRSSIEVFARILNEEGMRADRIDDSLYDNARKVSIIARELADICSRLTSQKSKYLRIYFNGSILTLSSISAQNEETFVNQIHVLDEDEIDEDDEFMVDPISIDIPAETAKSLSKIHNTSHQPSVINFYFIHGGEKVPPVKLVSAIGSFGRHTIYFKGAES